MANLKFETNEINGKVMLTSLETGDLKEVTLPMNNEDGDIIEGVASNTAIGEAFSILNIPATYGYFEPAAFIDCYNLTEVHIVSDSFDENVDLDEIFIKEGQICFFIDRDVKETNYITKKNIKFEYVDIFKENGILFKGDSESITITAFPKNTFDIYVPDTYFGKIVTIDSDVKNAEDILMIRFPKFSQKFFGYENYYASLLTAIYSPESREINIPRANELEEIIIGSSTKKITSFGNYTNLKAFNLDSEEIEVDLEPFKDSPWFDNFKEEPLYKKIRKSKESPLIPDDADIDDINDLFIGMMEDVINESRTSSKKSNESEMLVNLINLTRKMAIADKLQTMTEEEIQDAIPEIARRERLLLDELMNAGIKQINVGPLPSDDDFEYDPL